jgi:integrase
MARRPTGYWDDRVKAYFCRIGPISEVSGKARPLMLKDDNGVRLPYSGPAEKSPAVQGAIRRILAERAEAERRQAGPTVGDVVDAFVQWHRDQGSAPQTIQDHVYRLTRFGRFSWGGVPYHRRAAASISLKDLARFRKDLEAKGNQTGSLKIWYGSILACWRWAARPVEDREPERLIPSNPFEGLARPKRGKFRKQYIPPVVADRLLEFAAERIARLPSKARRLEPRRLLALKLIVTCGCRPFEAAALEWREIDWNERLIVIPPRSEGGRSKTRKGRRFGLQAEQVAELEALRDDPEGDSRWAFAVVSRFRRGAPRARDLGIWFRGLRDEAIGAGVPLDPATTLYWFRHTWQTIGLGVVKVERLAAASGNTPELLLSTYDQTQNAEIREVADAIAEARRKT